MKRVSFGLNLARTAAAAAVMLFGLAAPDAAFACRALIGDFVWHDLNKNGIQDAGEPGISGALVTMEALDGTVLKSVLTNPAGYYTFASSIEDKLEPPVCETTYRIKVTLPAGSDLVPTLLHVGSNREVDSNDPAGTLVTPTDPDGDTLAQDLSIDFGFQSPPLVCVGTIGDFVWNDANNNGRQDAGEAGIPGAVVSLSGASSTSQGTSASGAYLFSNLCAGSYVVCVDIPTGMQPSPANAAGVPVELDSNGSSNGSGASCASVSLPPGGNDPTIDFGFWTKQVQNPGTGTPGYWKNHPEAWPVETIVIGGVLYTKAQAMSMMGLDGGDKTLTMFRHLVAAKLNVLIGNDSSCIAGTISAADAWLAAWGPAGSGVKSKSVAWKAGEPLSWELDAYNNGDRCAPARN